MKSGATDTHDLAEAAKAQAKNAVIIAEATKAQAKANNTIAESAKAQVTSTREMAAQAIAQANASRSIADATAKQAADTQTIAQAAKAQSEISRDQLRTSHRPWVTVTGEIKTISPVTFTSDRVHATITYSLKNAGTSPALMASTSPSIIARNASNNPAIAPPCTRMAAIYDSETTLAGTMLVPGQETEVANVTVQQRAETMPRLVSVLLEVCIAYRDEFDIFHLTGEYWIYRRNDKAGEYAPVGIIDGEWKAWGVRSVAY